MMKSLPSKKPEIFARATYGYVTYRQWHALGTVGNI